MTRKTHKDAVDFKPVDWTGIYPPPIPRKAVPNHIALVMDGNGRWANAKGLTRVGAGGGVDGEDIVVHRVSLANIEDFIATKRAATGRCFIVAMV